MAKDSNNTKLWIGSGLRIDEIHDVLGETTGDLGSLCKSSNINAWARYKPFRNPSKGFEATTNPAKTAAENWGDAMTDAGFGFGSTYNNLNFGWNNDSPEWASFYHNNGKPRGVGNGYNEPYRQLDFADLNSKGSGTGVTTNGYNEAMLPPLKINFPSELEQGGSTITVQKDSNVGNSSVWNSSEGIAFNEVLPASLTNYNLAVLFKNGSYGNILVMGYTPATLGTNGASTVMVNGLSTAEGITLPMFDQTSSYDHKAVDGSPIKTTVALIPGRNITTGNYEILYVGNTSDTSHQSYNGDLLSLNMLGGMDSRTLTYYVVNSIRGSEGSVIASLAAPTTSGNHKVVKINSIGTTITPGPYWGDRASVSCQFSISITGAVGWYLSTSSDSTGDTDPSDTSQPYSGSESTVVQNKSTGNPLFTTTGSGTVTVVLDGNTYSSAGDMYKIKMPYIHMLASSGVTCKVNISGRIFAGTSLGDMGTTIDLTSFESDTITL